jgi:23S rRNA (uracil1939-C5)-methyltransferase
VLVMAGQQIALTIDKPAAGGRMIARHEGQVVLVSGAIPGERVRVRIERVGKGVAYGATIAVDDASPDRRDPYTDPSCGGCLYAHVAYSRQLTLKAQIIVDACARIGRFTAPLDSNVVSSPDDGYRMRARLHVREGRAGFYREGTHVLCDARATRQLLASSCDAIDALLDRVRPLGARAVHELEVSENVDASERVIHLMLANGSSRQAFTSMDLPPGTSGLTFGELAHGSSAIVAGGTPFVTDTIVAGQQSVKLRRHVLSFFQGNRFLLNTLVAHVMSAVPPGAAVVDLYAGVGLFAAAAAATRDARVTAVEGDRMAGADLAANAGHYGGAIEPVHQPVERFVARRHPRPDVVIVDPPRTGVSKEALAGTIALGAKELVYVSCDVATFARDGRTLLDAGYTLSRMHALDLFPNTPHVETVAVFEDLRT